MRPVQLAVLLVVAVAASGAAQVDKKVAKRGALGAGGLGSWDQLSLLSTFHPYAALLGGGGNLFHGDNIGLASSPHLDLYGLGGGPNYGGLGLLNVGTAAQVGYNPYFSAAPNPYRNLLSYNPYRNNNNNIIPQYSPASPNLQYPQAPRPTPTFSTPTPTPDAVDKAINTFANTAIYSTAAPLKNYTPALNYEAIKSFNPSPTYSPSKPFVPSTQYEPVKSSYESYEPVKTSQNSYEPTRLSLYTNAPSPLDVKQPQGHQDMTSAVLPAVSTTVSPYPAPRQELKLSATYSSAATSQNAATPAPRFAGYGHPVYGVYGTAFPPTYRDQPYFQH
ncbi:uncharacterized protein LOC132201547 [Neocloeon triangulifer]|uniref:uncharacterized protein LOC132201547 n=1 Tax=Neocloeon triangulifer TaxID=2078957 RepID=UPI00286F965F|nr:uncharacterized protein LOC132201547 [Neocloeon triangulifer]